MPLPSNDLYHLIVTAGPCAGIVGVAVWFAIQEWLDRFNKF